MIENVPVKLFLVDDHAVVRQGVKMMLSRYKDILVIGEASSGLRALELVRKNMPDIILMDIKMPGDIGGLGTTVKLKSTHPEIKIIILSTCEEEPLPARLMSAGASGYLHKSCTSKELVQAIRQVNKGVPYVTSKLLPQIIQKAHTGKTGTPFDLLSDREMTVAMMLSNGLSPKEIAQKLCISNKTVNTYRYRSFEKLKINNNIELTHLAFKYKLTNKEEHVPET
ncbi:MAG: response regulator [Gammaproteobacteria bacterium]